MIRRFVRALLLLAVPAAHGSVFHHKHDERKAINKEVQAIVSDDMSRTAAMLNLTWLDPKGKAVIQTLMTLDLSLIETHLVQFDHGHCTEAELDKYIAQASRDLETFESEIPPNFDHDSEPAT